MRSPSDPPNSEKSRKPGRPASREDRLKAALKANMARRKAQARARAAGADVAGLIRDVPDPAVWAIVQSWPRRFAASRARALGFRAEDNFDQIVRAYIEDDLGKG